jgi:predicted nucleotidyltransferase
MELLNALAADVRGVLGSDLVGLYLYGSSVTGDFDPGVSDIDLVAVTAPEVDAIDLAGLERMHQRFVDRHPEWRDRLEIVYISHRTLESFRNSVGSLAVISPGEPFHVREDRVVDWLQNWYLVRETGIPLYGPDPATLFPRVTWTEFISATRRYMKEIRDQSREGAGPGELSYSILTMCRALRTVHLGIYSSKQQGAAWVRDRMPEWASVIDAALETRRSHGATGFADEDSRRAADAFLDRIVDEAGATAGAS